MNNLGDKMKFPVITVPITICKWSLLSIRHLILDS